MAPAIMPDPRVMPNSALVPGALIKRSTAMLKHLILN